MAPSITLSFIALSSLLALSLAATLTPNLAAQPAARPQLTKRGLSAQSRSAEQLPTVSRQSVTNVLIELGPGDVIPPHFHPDTIETFQVVRGRLGITLWLDGLDGRSIFKIVGRGQKLTLPPGAIHSVECISRVDCVDVSTFDPADPETIFVE